MSDVTNDRHLNRPEPAGPPSVRLRPVLLPLRLPRPDLQPSLPSLLWLLPPSLLLLPLSSQRLTSLLDRPSNLSDGLSNPWLALLLMVSPEGPCTRVELMTVDEFIQMLLTFPIDPPAADRPGILEVISDSVYANSSTLDGRRFAQEFFTRRKADAARPKGSAGTVSKTSLADVVKSVPKKVEDAGFRVVKAKGKKKN
jgi:hypothetical protein